MSQNNISTEPAKRNREVVFFSICCINALSSWMLLMSDKLCLNQMLAPLPLPPIRHRHHCSFGRQAGEKSFVVL